MSKYGDWTPGERKPTVEETMPQPPLVGTLVKKIVVQPYNAKSLAEAIELGKYDGHDGDIVTIFADDEVGLTEEVSVDLFRYDQDWTYDRVVAWAKENGNKRPILPKHIHGIGIYLPDEQREAPIVETGSLRRGHVLSLFGDSDWRGLLCDTVEGYWSRNYLVGFLSE